MSSPKISVVIPAYRAALFLERTLESVADQTFRDFEIIVVDDGSPDDTLAVAQRFLSQRNLPGRAIRQPNGKIASARNHALRYAKGELIAFLDHDDRWTPDKLAVVAAEFERDPGAGLVHHPCRIVDAGGNVLGKTHNGPWKPDMYRHLLLVGNRLCPSAVTVRSEALVRVGGFREDPRFDTVEDYDLWMRLSRVIRFRFIPPMLGDHLMVPGGASKRARYHYDNQEHLLQDHFASIGRAGVWTRLLMRRRLAEVKRAAARALMRGGAAAEAAPYVSSMLRLFPVAPRNLSIAALWVIARSPLSPLAGPVLRSMKY